MSIDVNVQNDLVIVTESSEDITVNVSNAAGPAGVGVPVGGSTGQVLKKLSNTNYDTYWALDGGGVPYVGATGDVDLGEYELKAGQIEFDQTPTGAAGVGVMRWNDSDGTLDLGLKGGNVTLQVGQEQILRVVNKTGANLLESQYRAVRIRLAAEGGSQGQRLAVVLAQGNNDANSADTIGIVTENISDNQEGFICTSGIVRGINTTGSLQGETWGDGDIIYLSPTTPGAITKVKPIAPSHSVVLGYVIYAHAVNGKIFVKCDNGYELGELHNVNTNGVTNGQVLAYDSVDGVWKPSLDGIFINGMYVGNRNGGDYDTYATIVGYDAAANSDKLDITAIGYRALKASGGDDSTAIGANALRFSTEGFNTAVGSQSLYNLTTGTYNTAIGYQSGSYGGNILTTGANNIFVGYRAVGVLATESNRTWIGNDSTESTWLGGNLLLGTKTNSGYLLDVNGNGRMNQLLLTTINNATTDTDRFLVSDSGVIKYRTGTEILSDIGAFVLPSLTSGSVLFSNGTTLAQDNSNLFWDDTNNRLGIGTNAPAFTFHVNGPNAGLYITRTSPDESFIQLSNQTITSGGQIRGLATSVGLRFTNQLGNTEWARFFSTGNFGINTGGTDSGQRFQVQGTTLLNGNVTFSSATGMFWDAANSRLGIGTNTFYTPNSVWWGGTGQQQKIFIKSTSSSNFTSLVLSGGLSGSGGNAIQFLDYNGTPIADFGTADGAEIGFAARQNTANINFYTTPSGTSPTKRMSIFASGNVLLQAGGTFTDAGFRLDVNGTARVSGDFTIADTRNIILATGTGTKIGTATSQKLSFWNATPIVQPTTAVAEASFVENLGGSIVNVDSTFDGYTMQQVVKALRNMGALA